MCNNMVYIPRVAVSSQEGREGRKQANHILGARRKEVVGEEEDDIRYGRRTTSMPTVVCVWLFS